MSGDPLVDTRRLQDLSRRNERLLIELLERAHVWYQSGTRSNGEEERRQASSSARALPPAPSLTAVLWQLAAVRYEMGYVDLFRAAAMLGPRVPDGRDRLAVPARADAKGPAERTGRTHGRWLYHFKRLREKSLQRPTELFTMPLHLVATGELTPSLRVTFEVDDDLLRTNLVNGRPRAYHTLLRDRPGTEGAMEMMASMMESYLRALGRRKTEFDVSEALMHVCFNLDILTSVYVMIVQDENMDPCFTPYASFVEEFQRAEARRGEVKRPLVSKLSDDEWQTRRSSKEALQQIVGSRMIRAP